MASGAVFDAIKSYLQSNWVSTPIRFENEPLYPLPEAFVDVEMTGTFYGQESLGASHQKDNRWDEEGQLWLHSLVLINSGGSVVRTQAKALADLFRGLLLLNDSLEFRDAFIGRGQPGFEDGAYYRVSVYINYRRMDA
jgi:hypothetical protein